jgi:hypothetical protein
MCVGLTKTEIGKKSCDCNSGRAGMRGALKMEKNAVIGRISKFPGRKSGEFSSKDVEAPNRCN